MVFNLISSKDSDEIRTMLTKSDNIEIMMINKRDEIIEELFESLSQRYQEGLEEKMKGREFVFDSVHLLHYNLHKISLNRGGSYIDSPEWLKNKKTTINPKNNADKCFQYTLTVALNFQNIKKIQKEYQKLRFLLISMIGKRFPSHKNNWKNSKSNNESIAFNILMYLIILKK